MCVRRCTPHTVYGRQKHTDRVHAAQREQQRLALEFVDEAAGAARAARVTLEARCGVEATTEAFAT